ncbi:hypothetical protein AAFC00_001282 [Neodothiora populina]|uniref:Uncharacterized protein n=1 Tax=Neodothiora populina TaxID=2781224 RepID=A0ABR3PND5_9PEZI
MSSSVYSANSSESFDSICDRLKTFPTPLLPPGKSYDGTLTDKISSLYCHPALEALLHILNLDLPSAHFLCRKMQSAPAYEGMYIHGLLHRIEGDLDNTRAWYADVQDSDCFISVWGEATHEERKEADSIKDQYRVGKAPAQKRTRDFLDAVENLQKHKQGDREALEKESRREINELLRWCKDKFGAGKWEDAKKVWVGNSEEIKNMSQDMTTGDKGHRHF